MAADLLHAGHVTALEQAKKNCDKLIVLLNCYPALNAPHKRVPAQSVFERFWQIRAVKWVDDVIPYEGEPDLIVTLGSLDYDVRFVGSDYKGKTWTGKEMEEERGIEPCFLTREFHGLSTTELIGRVKGKNS